MTESAHELLDSWIAKRARPGGASWLSSRVAHAAQRGADASFYMSFSAVPRHLGKADLALEASEAARADRARAGWSPALWSVDQAGRARLVLALPAADRETFAAVLDRLFGDADLGELVALYRALPLYPHPQAHRARAAEGVRTNMKAVFEAVALDNPYPAEQLDADAFNQLVLKALFIGSPLHRVRGLDGRVTPGLAAMLADYAHERWAAGRPVAPELWRCVGPVAEGSQLGDLEQVLETGTEAERLAAALSCRDNPRAADLKERFGDVFSRLATEPLSWSDLARREE